MQWRNEGIALGKRDHGEHHCILDVFTRDYGRWKGLVLYGNTRRRHAALRVSNVLDVKCRIRTEEQLGTFTIEVVQTPLALCIDHKHGVYTINYFIQLLSLLPEREPYPELFMLYHTLLETIQNTPLTIAKLICLERDYLSHIGYGLALTHCVVTKNSDPDQLTYVSPKTGCAVIQSVGLPYKEHLFLLPNFLTKPIKDILVAPSIVELIQGAKITKHFISRYGLTLRHNTLLGLREQILNALNEADT